MKKEVYSIAEIAKLEGITVEVVRRWAIKNKVKKLSDARTAPYLFSSDDYSKFKKRNRKAGRKFKK